MNKDDYFEAREHPRWDGSRVLLTRREIEQLPAKLASREEIWKAMCRWHYNPTAVYPKDMPLLASEAGHDDCYRYIEA